MGRVKSVFETIPGVGKSIAQDLLDLGFSNVDQLAKESLENMYKNLCRLRGEHIDRCVLYVFRCAVYYAKTSDPEPELLKWWNWKNAAI